MFKLVIGIAVTLASVCAEIPIAFHQLVTVDPNGDSVIRLTGYDLEGDVVSISSNIFWRK